MYSRIISVSATQRAATSQDADHELIDENCHHELPVKDLAALTGLSIHHLLHPLHTLEKRDFSLHRYIIHPLKKSRLAMTSKRYLRRALDCASSP
jgi:hypothetical protein